MLLHRDYKKMCLVKNNALLNSLLCIIGLNFFRHWNFLLCSISWCSIFFVLFFFFFPFCNIAWNKDFFAHYPTTVSSLCDEKPNKDMTPTDQRVPIGNNYICNFQNGFQSWRRQTINSASNGKNSRGITQPSSD